MSITRNSFKRPAALFAAAAILVGVAVPTALMSLASAAATQLQPRSVQLSDSAAGATAQQYKVTFKTAAAMQSLVLTFCSGAGSPLFGDTNCPAPTGFVIGSTTSTDIINATPAVTWTPTVTGSTIKLASSASIATGTDVTFTLTKITNQTNVGTFFARITTYTGANFGLSEGTAWTGAGTEGAYVEYGGVAMATTDQIEITAKVQETMMLCTSATVFTGTNCAGQSAPKISLGGGPNNDVIDSTQAWTKNAYSQISTNAYGGYAIYMKAANVCGGGLTKDPVNDVTCGIPAVGGGFAAGGAIAAGQPAGFGATVSNGNFVGTGTGTNSAVAKWTSTYVMDDQTANDNVKYVYGSKVIEAPNQQADGVVNTFTFAAKSSLTTPAGVYTQKFSLIGVGTF